MTRWKLLRDMGEGNSSFERIRFFCLALDGAGLPYLMLPAAFTLELAEGVFTTDIEARHDSILLRAVWQSAFHGSKLTGGKAEEEQPPVAAPPARQGARPSTPATGLLAKNGSRNEKIYIKRPPSHCWTTMCSCTYSQQ